MIVAKHAIDLCAAGELKFYGAERRTLLGLFIGFSGQRRIAVHALTNSEEDVYTLGINCRAANWKIMARGLLLLA